MKLAKVFVSFNVRPHIFSFFICTKAFCLMIPSKCLFRPFYITDVEPASNFNTIYTADPQEFQCVYCNNWRRGWFLQLLVEPVYFNITHFISNGNISNGSHCFLGTNSTRCDCLYPHKDFSDKRDEYSDNMTVFDHNTLCGESQVCVVLLHTLALQ